MHAIAIPIPVTVPIALFVVAKGNIEAMFLRLPVDTGLQVIRVIRRCLQARRGRRRGNRRRGDRWRRRGGGVGRRGRCLAEDAESERGGSEASEKRYFHDGPFAVRCGQEAFWIQENQEFASAANSPTRARGRKQRVTR